MSLAQLPVELLHATLTHLAPEDLAAVAAASRALKAAAYDERLWTVFLRGGAPWQICGADLPLPGAAILARHRYARACTRCAQCLQRTFPVEQQNHARPELRRMQAQRALGLSREKCAQISAALQNSSGVSIAVWPNRHGTRVWMAEQSRLEREEAAEELKLLCSRDAFHTPEGWTEVDGGGEAFLGWRWDKDMGLEWAEVERFLLEAVTDSDRERYLPPLRASTVEARLQLEMRAKMVALERVLLDGDCVFGFSLSSTVATVVPDASPLAHFSSVFACQRSSERVLRLADGKVTWSTLGFEYDHNGRRYYS